MAERAELLSYLQTHDVDYDEHATDEQLEAQVLAKVDADHARFLETYTPVLTRLPDAVGTAPEQPEPEDTESGGAGLVNDGASSQPPEPVNSEQAPAGSGDAAAEGSQPQGATATGADEQPQT